MYWGQELSVTIRNPGIIMTAIRIERYRFQKAKELLSLVNSGFKAADHCAFWSCAISALQIIFLFFSQENF
jgi:hypothetical protein